MTPWPGRSRPTVKCRRAFETDLTAFVLDQEEARFAGFRAHYPDCADCAAEVEVWCELEEQLRTPGGARLVAHPEPALLLRLEEDPRSLAVAEVRSLKEHLADCASCRDELTSLRAFDFAALESTAWVKKPADRLRPTWRETAGRIAGRTRALVLHPAFGYGLVVILLIPAVFRLTEQRVLTRDRAEPGSMLLADKAKTMRVEPTVPVAQPTLLAPSTDAAPGIARVARGEDDRPPVELPAPERAAMARQVMGEAGTSEGGTAAPVDGRVRFSAAAPTEPVRTARAEPDVAAVASPMKDEVAEERILAPKPAGRGIVAAMSTDSDSHAAAVAPSPSRAVQPPSVRTAPMMENLYGGLALQSRAWQAPDRALSPDIWLLRDRSSELAAARAARGLKLRVPLPPERDRAEHYTVAVAEVDGEREIRQAFAVTKTSEHLDVVVPPNWLRTGKYRIDLLPVRVGRTEDRTHRYELAVR